MATHFTEKTLPYSAKQLFALVADIKSYPLYLPWCEAVEIIEDRGSTIVAELVIGFNRIHGKYTSHVTLDEEHLSINVELVEGPFHHLYQRWNFSPEDDKKTLVHFDIDFEMKSFVLERTLDLIFDSACEKMMQAFEVRAKELYGQRGG